MTMSNASHADLVEIRRVQTDVERFLCRLVDEKGGRKDDCDGDGTDASENHQACSAKGTEVLKDLN